MVRRSLLPAFGVVMVSLLSLLSACSSSREGRPCDSGMCTTQGVALTEPQFRERASAFAHDRLVTRQQSSHAITGPDSRSISVGQIDPDSWDVTMSNGQWHAKRHLTRDFWQVVECGSDGSAAFDSIEVGPTPAPKS